MIITLKGATGSLSFETNRIGVLSKWNITRVIDSGVTYSGPTSVDKGASFNATLTLASGYAYTDGVTVTMGGTAVDASCIVTSGNTTTITISSVTGNITIKALTYDTTTGDTTTPGTGTSNGISYAYELGKSIQTSTGNVLEGDTYKHLTLVTLSSDNTQNLTMHLANGYSYKVFYYKNDSFVSAYNSNYEEVIYNNEASWLLINQPTLDYDTIKIIYKETEATSTTHTAVSPDDVGLEFRNIWVDNDYELGTSIQSTYGYLLYDDNSTYSHIGILKPINYQDNLLFKINDGYVWAIYAFDSKMNYLGTHDGATSSPWETATSNYAVSQVKTQWADVAYITAAYKATNGVGGENVNAPSVSGAAFY